MPRQKTAYSYVRFSTPDQLHGDSLRRQLAKSEETAARFGYVLDRRSFRDLGLSGFRGKNHKSGDLAAFIKAVDDGDIPKGSLLVLENIDRLTREQPMHALNLITSILKMGVKIATHNSTRMLDESADMAATFELVMQVCLAHDESAKKSDRVGHAWKQKKANAALKPLGNIRPAWIEFANGKFRLIPERARVVKQIFQMCIAGKGTHAITRHLNEKGIPLIGGRKNSKTWHSSYVRKILTNRATFGEYQPCVGHANNRKPSGEPVENYYPAAVSLDEFQRATNALANRRTQKGPDGKHLRNLFTGLLVDAESGSSFNIVDKGRRSSGPQLVASAAKYGRGGTYKPFPYGEFEIGILAHIREITSNDLLGKPQRNTAQQELDELKATLKDCEDRITKIKKRMETDDLDSLFEVLAKMEAKRNGLRESLQDAKRRMSSIEEDQLQETQSLIEGLGGRTFNEVELFELRQRLRALLRATIEQIVVEITDTDHGVRQANCMIHFVGGSKRRVKIGAYRKANYQFMVSGSVEVKSST